MEGPHVRGISCQIVIIFQTKMIPDAVQHELFSRLERQRLAPKIQHSLQVPSPLSVVASYNV